MRLINTRTLKIHQFHGRTVPLYAILSHTWGDGEVSLQDFHSEAIRASKRGFAKIKNACQEARNQRLEYLWVDTCCIDKTSSAELGEAINSMYKWYQGSAICFAYLEDMAHSPSSSDERGELPEGSLGRLRSGSATRSRLLDPTFKTSRWFTRGWTLQELIAPANVHFYNQAWKKVEEKTNITAELETITGVDEIVLQGASPEEVSVGKRMSWASERDTTRQEDVAYSLFGIFNVNLPLIYGEGEKAFFRLQEEIFRQSDDHTLFAW
ncbi:heterokaryon incompatibility protein-domain-containing protein, partial [Podospora didyma]